MATLFEIWLPRCPSPGVVEVDVTRANLPMLDRLSRQWVDGCLAAIGVTGRSRNWEIRAARCNYYAAYPESDDWEDRWRLTWSVRIALASAQELRRPGLRTLPIPFEERDPTWHFDESGEVAVERGVVQFAESRRVPAGEQEARSAHAMARLVALGMKDLSETRFALDGDWQMSGLHFACDDFARRARDLDKVVSELEADGTVVNWSQPW